MRSYLRLIKKLSVVWLFWFFGLQAFFVTSQPREKVMENSILIAQVKEDRATDIENIATLSLKTQSNNNDKLKHDLWRSIVLASVAAPLMTFTLIFLLIVSLYFTDMVLYDD